jgi:hypothetical protein
VWVQEIGGATQQLADKFRDSVYPAVLASKKHQKKKNRYSLFIYYRVTPFFSLDALETIALWVGCLLGGVLFLVAIVCICIGFNHSRRSRRGYELIQ